MDNIESSLNARASNAKNCESYTITFNTFKINET